MPQRPKHIHTYTHTHICISKHTHTSEMPRLFNVFTFLLLLVGSLASLDPTIVRRRHEWFRKVALLPNSPSAPPSSLETLQLQGENRIPVLLRQEGTEAERKLGKSETRQEDVREGNITLTKELLTGLLQEVVQYLRKDMLLVLYPRGDRGRLLFFFLSSSSFLFLSLFLSFSHSFHPFKSLQENHLIFLFARCAWR